MPFETPHLYRHRSEFAPQVTLTNGGSATANLGGWCLAMGRTLPCEFEISQGEYAGRPSTLLLRVDLERRILVSGDVIELGRGAITL